MEKGSFQKLRVAFVIVKTCNIFSKPADSKRLIVMKLFLRVDVMFVLSQYLKCHIPGTKLLKSK